MQTVAGSFRDADRTDDMQSLLHCLDFMNDLPVFRAYKARSWALMAPGDGGHYLDLACGTGFDAIAMARRWPGARFTGADHSVRFLEVAQARGAGMGNLAFVPASATALPFAAGEFDGARIDRALQHIEGPQAVLAGMARCTRPGGVVVACEPDWASFVLDSGQEAADRALAARWVGLFRNPRIGADLPALFPAAGIAPEVAEVTRLDLTRLAEASVVFDLPRLLAGSVTAGLLSAAEAAAWQAGAEAASAAGRFRADLAIHTLSGRVG